MATTHERDFAAWAHEQAELLRAGRLSEADINHIAEEIESMGRSEKRALISHLAVLMMHLLKWQYQPARRSRSGILSMENARDAVRDVLEDNPSLTAGLDAYLVKAYRYARRDAANETGLHEATFPDQAPWRYDELMNTAFDE